jgi:hypothetical protein
MSVLIDLSASLLAVLMTGPSLTDQWATAAAATAAADEPVREPGRKHKRKHKRRHKTVEPQVDPALVEADERRRVAISEATPLVGGRRYADAAQQLAGVAEQTGDPVLYLAAAEAQLADSEVAPAELERAAELARRGEALADDPVQARIDPGIGPQLAEHGQQLANFAGRRREAWALHRRSRAELAAGGVFLGFALSGVGLLVGGAVLGGRVDDALAAHQGPEYDAYRASLDGVRGRSEAMLAAGLIAGLAGAAIGIPLTITGARDRSRSRDGRTDRPIFRIAPGFAGLSLSGRF